jgi:WD40 repeat protein
MARVFVSHASQDRQLADEVHRWLSGDGHEVFLDHHPDEGIALGEAWEQRLYERLRWADAMVCLVTSAYLASPWCAAEVGVARSQGSRMLPLLAELGVEYPLLEWSQYADLVSDPVAARAALGAALRRVDAAGGLGWQDGRSPFPGLRPFDVDQRRVFFGRASEVQALVELLRSPAERAGRRVLLVVGPSGCGKSSLVRAGLLPVVADEPGWWVLPPLVPGADPVGALGRELAAGARPVGLDWTVGQVRERLDAGRLGELADELLLAAPGPGQRRRLLVVVDQFEELLTQATPVARAGFAELLRPALDNPIQVVATLRPEFLAQLLASPELAGLPTRVSTLRPLRREALATVIKGPARLAGIEVEEQLVERLVADTDSGEALPLLAFTLQQLADGVGRGGRLSAARYEQLGGVQGALVEQSNAALVDARAASGRSSGEVIGGLLRLVTVDEQGRPTRWRVDRAELPEPVRIELDAFVARRLLTTDTDNDTIVLEVTHEAFLSAWPPLAGAITAAASALRMRRAVEQAATVWDENGRPSSRLWERGQLAAAVNDTGARIRPAGQSGSRLPSAVTSSLPRRPLGLLPWGNRVLIADKVELSQRARTFLHASIRLDRRRRRRATTILSVLLVLAITAAGVAVNQQRAAQHQQRVATAGGLVAQADAVRDSDPRTALLLGIAARHIDPNGETQASLVNTLTATPYAATLTGHSGPVFSVAFAADGRTLAALGGPSVILWDLTDHARPRRLGQPLTGHSEGVSSMALAPDGRTLATGGADQTVTLWDLTDRTQPRLGRPLTGHSGGVSSMAFAPDGRTLAVARFDQTVSLWDLADRGRPRRLGQPLPGHREGEMSVAFAPDGRTLATGNDDQTISLWDLANPTTRPRRLGQPLAGHGEGAVLMAFAPDGHTLAVGGADHMVTLWDLADRGRPRRLGQPLTGHSEGVISVAFAPDGRILAAGGGDRAGMVSLWNLADRARPHRLDHPLAGHSDPVKSMAFTPDGRTLAVGSNEATVRLWDLTDPTQPRRLGQLPTGHGIAEVSVAFAPDGRTLATGDSDQTVTFWDLTDRGRPRRLGQAHSDAVDSAFSPMAFAPDGHTLAVGNSDQTVSMWHLADRGRPRRLGEPLTQSGAVNSVAFTPDGHTLAIGGDDHTVTLWHLADRGRPRRLGQPLTHNAAVTSVAFAPDGHTLATGSDDHTISLWDLANQNRPRRLGQPITGHRGPVWSVAIAPDGHTLAAGSDDQTVSLWDLTELSNLRLHAVERACSLTQRGLDRDEWIRYVPGLPYQATCPN